MRVDIRDHVVRDELLEIAGGDRTRIHRTVVHRLRIRQDDDHLFCALGKGAFDRLRHVDFVGPLLGADGVTVQRIHDRIAAVFVFAVARRQEDEDVAVDGVALQVAFQRRYRES